MMMDADLHAIFDEVLKERVRKTPVPQVTAGFYPYAGLSSTIRLRQGRVYARVSDILRHSPREVLRALACILIAKLYRHRIPVVSQRLYREYASRPEVLEASEATRRHRGYKITSSPRGRVYDLEEVFDDLNRRYFEEALERPVLSWSLKPTSRVFGHHDGVHATVVISRTLDSERVPRLAVEYVLYHEMLHIKHPPQDGGRRRIYHSREFRADEQRFEKYDEAVDLLNEIASTARRKKQKLRRR